MNTSQLSKYAPEARKAFIAAVTGRATRLGITAEDIASAEVKGDVLLIGGQAFPKAIAPARKALLERIQSHGFDQAMEAIAYTWFNRLVAIRYMELHGYLDHGYRVLSHPEGNRRPEILDHAAEVDLPGLDRDKAIELKLDGTKDEELYRLLLLAQCNALHQVMPFLFERIGDETELLLPTNLLHTDSLIRQLVESVDEELWQDIEIIGWLYQFYISEKKDQVIGKKVKPEDIPAATQLFTPNWIVKYLVQNSLGAQWLATYPDSPLKEQMEYYIEPAEQTEEVQQQLAEITPERLDPEELTLIDPASGSGHILVEAYKLFKAIYLERGYRQRDVPKLILEKNLYGLEICPRAAQLTGFALMMKGRADDRRLFGRGVQLNVMALQDSEELDADALTEGLELDEYGVNREDVNDLKQLFEQASLLGSLIQLPEELADKLPQLKQLSREGSHDLFVGEALAQLGRLVRQAEMLVKGYDAVVANPPYMGSKAFHPQLKSFVRHNFPAAKSDLFACFIARGNLLANAGGYNSMVTMESWMFLSSYEELRKIVLREYTLRNLAHFPYDGKRPTAMGINFGVVAASIRSAHLPGYRGHYCCSRHYELGQRGEPIEFPTPNERLNIVASNEFEAIPGQLIVYWVSEAVRRAFVSGEPLDEIATAKPGLCTGRDRRFLREWPEVSFRDIGLGCHSRESSRESGKTWFPFNKGGPFRRWFGNQSLVVNWRDDGSDLRAFAKGEGKGTRIQNVAYYFRSGITWNQTGSAIPSFRMVPPGFIPAHIGAMAFPESDRSARLLAGFLNSCVSRRLLEVISPTMGLEVGHVSNLPVKEPAEGIQAVGDLVRHSHTDWDAYERSWNFQSLPILKASADRSVTLESSYEAWTEANRETITEMKRVEEANNHLFIAAYGLQDELTPEVPLEEISLTVNPAYRYGGKLTEEEQWTRFRQDTMEELVSYAVGCMTGRYSLDQPGLIYAHSGNEGFDPRKYSTFPADEDGIVPLTDTEWFDDDAAHRLVEFISVAWDASHLEENLTFLADNLGPRKKESSRETIRRYLNDKFFKAHLKTYKKRPIYWLFSSGKQKAFQCLVYLHRYNEGTLARMRSEYVIPLQGKMAARIEKLEADVEEATSTAHRKRLEKELGKLEKQQVELVEFDEKLRHYADRRISLDLDDGVKVNYGKFGDLLADVKAVHGKKPETV